METVTTYVNRNWRMKVSGQNEGKRVHKLVGVSGLIEIVGMDLFFKMVLKAKEKAEDKVVFKLRRGLLVTFYSK